MFYKYENGERLVSNEVHFPDGTKITASDKEDKYGWSWFDEPPTDYLIWADQLKEFSVNS